MLGFYFPPQSGEKVTLEITILMALTFYMNQAIHFSIQLSIFLQQGQLFQVSEMQPPSSETPLIGIYFSCIMIIVANSVVCTIFIINFHHRLAANCVMPLWIRTLFLLWLPWLLRQNRLQIDKQRMTKKSLSSKY